MTIMTNKKTATNSTYPKGGVSCSNDSFVINGSLVFQIKFCSKSPALRVDANRYLTLKRIFKYSNKVVNCTKIS